MSKYKVKWTSQFKKDIKKSMKQNKDINKLKEVVEKLSNGEILDDKYKDHKIKNSDNVRDCHIEPDWVLLYKYFDDVLILLLIRVGSHSDLKL